MGLDMYLRAEKFVAGYDHNDTDERRLYKQAVGMLGLSEAADPTTPHAQIKVTVAYWRKANAIHRWFVENIQNGDDDCQSYDVGRSQLVELRDLCKTTIADRGKVAVASENLPTQAGFFFGGTDYDDWYWQGIEDTVEQLNRVLEQTPEDVYFEYQSSW